MEDINKSNEKISQNHQQQNQQFGQQIDFAQLAQMGNQLNMMMHQAQAQQPPQAGSYEDTVNYYQHEACRLYIANVVLTNQVKELLADKNDLLVKIAKLEKRHQDSIIYTEEKKKRSRRPAQDIERHYKCPQEPCQKSYGSEGSLAQHIKLKHPEFYITISNNISQSLQPTVGRDPAAKDNNSSQLENNHGMELEQHSHSIDENQESNSSNDNNYQEQNGQQQQQIQQQEQQQQEESVQQQQQQQEDQGQIQQQQEEGQNGKEKEIENNTEQQAQNGQDQQQQQVQENNEQKDQEQAQQQQLEQQQNQEENESKEQKQGEEQQQQEQQGEVEEEKEKAQQE